MVLRVAMRLIDQEEGYALGSSMTIHAYLVGGLEVVSECHISTLHITLLYAVRYPIDSSGFGFGTRIYYLSL